MVRVWGILRYLLDMMKMRDIKMTPKMENMQIVNWKFIRFAMVYIKNC